MKCAICKKRDGAVILVIRGPQDLHLGIQTFSQKSKKLMRLLKIEAKKAAK